MRRIRSRFGVFGLDSGWLIAVGIITVATLAVLIPGSPLHGADPGQQPPTTTPTATPVPGLVTSYLSSVLHIQNLDRGAPANVMVDFYGPDELQPPVSVVLEAIGPGGVAAVDLNATDELVNSAYSAVVSSSGPVGSWHRTEWTPREDVSTYADPRPAPSLVAPWYAKRSDGYKSVMFIQNAHPSEVAVVQVELIAYGVVTPTLIVNRTIAPRRMASVDPYGDGDLVRLPAGFDGWARMSANVSIAAVTIVENEQSVRSVLTYEAVPIDHLSSRLYAPLVHRRWPTHQGSEQELSSSIVILNPGLEPTTVNITYRGIAGECEGQVYHQEALDIEPAGRVVLPHGDWPPSDHPSPLPERACSFSAVIESSSGPVAGLVKDGLSWERGAAASSAYGALASPQGGLQVALPDVQRSHATAGISSTTGIHVQNVGETLANVTLELRGADGRPVAGCGADCTAEVEPGSAKLWWPPNIPVLTDGWRGTAWVVADQPVSAVVYQVAEDGSLDMGIYGGISSPDNTLTTGESLAPYLAKRSSWTARRIEPSPTPTATSTPTPTPSPTSRPGNNYLPFAVTKK